MDAVYMTATQAMTGQGGWPMTVFMTPDQASRSSAVPTSRGDKFGQLVLNVSRAWRSQRGDVTDRAKQIAAALAENASATARACAAGLAAIRQLEVPRGRRTRRWRSLTAGTTAPRAGSAARRSSRRRWCWSSCSATTSGPGSPGALRMADRTCEAMARGGMYDQLGGGFARYSVDAGWVVPHFEKMLYDNALLARVYLNLWRRTGSELARRVAEETCDWMLRELRTDEGGFAASLDADSEGEEGKFYVWRPARTARDPRTRGRRVRGRGLRRHREPARSSAAPRCCSGARSPRTPPGWPASRTALLAARASRVRPGPRRQGGGRVERPGHLRARRRRAAAAPARLHRGRARRRRAAGRGPPGRRKAASAPRATGPPGNTAGALEDYACVAEGFLTLSGVTGQARWLTLAGELLEVALAAFGDGAGGFYDTAADGETLIFRPADPADNATPSGAFAVAGALLSYSALTGSARHREAAAAALGVLPAIAARYPRAAGTGLAVAEAWLAGPAEIAVVGDPDDERTRALHETALHAAPPGAVLALGDGTGPAGPTPGRRCRCLPGGGWCNGAPGRLRLPPVHLPGSGHHPGATQDGARRPVLARSGRGLAFLAVLALARTGVWGHIVEAMRLRRPIMNGRPGGSPVAPASGSRGDQRAGGHRARRGRGAGHRGRQAGPGERIRRRAAGGQARSGERDGAGGAGARRERRWRRQADGGAGRQYYRAYGHRFRFRRAGRRAVPARAGRPVARAAPGGPAGGRAVLAVRHRSWPRCRGSPRSPAPSPIEAAKIKINGTYTAVLGVDPSTFRDYAAGPTAASNPLWQGVADGGVAVSYTMGTLDRLSAGPRGHRGGAPAGTAAGGRVRHRRASAGSTPWCPTRPPGRWGCRPATPSSSARRPRAWPRSSGRSSGSCRPARRSSRWLRR